jgi:hypothetical protein
MSRPKKGSGRAHAPSVSRSAPAAEPEPPAEPELAAEPDLTAEPDLASGLPTGTASSSPDAVAVVIERADASCAVIYPGYGSSVASVTEAKDSVEKAIPGVVWRATTPSVWIAHTGES